VCTLAVAFGVDRRWPLVVAANRDERLGRPAEGWALRDLAGGTRAAAPRDVQAGGTWIGVGAHGLFAALTNFHAPDRRFPDPSRRSRGELVPAVLAAGSLGAARRAVQGLDAGRWNPFHLVASDGRAAFRWWHDGERTGLDELSPGLHLVTERDAEGRGPRGDWIRARWPLDLAPARLRELLSGHGEPQGDTPCIHHGELYGTRSATILRLAPALAHSELLVADGPPCTAPFEDRSRLLAEL